MSDMAFAAWVKQACSLAQQPPRCPRIALRVAGHVIGSVEPGVLEAIQQAGQGAACPLSLQIESTGPVWDVAVAPDEVTAALHAIAAALRTTPYCGPWRNEQLAVCTSLGQRVGTIERAAVRPLGIATQAVHLVGLDTHGAMWVQQRAWDKPNNPGLWDTLMGGMVAAQDSLEQALQRETWEEAGLQVAALAQLAYGGCVEFALPCEEGAGCGYMRERIDWFSATLPEGTVPCNQDGEVACFALRSPEAVRAAVADGQFTLEAGLVLAAFYASKLVAAMTMPSASA